MSAHPGVKVVPRWVCHGSARLGVAWDHTAMSQRAPRSAPPGRPILRGDVVARRRLLARLDSGFEVGAVCVSGSAGSGKTTLLATWLETLPSSVRAAWLTVRPEHIDQALLADDLRAVLMATRAAPQREFPSRSLGDILDVLVEPASGTRVVLVLDDVHLLQHEAVADAIGSVLGRLPRGSCFVVSGRGDPGLPWAVLRARRAMVEISDTDLRFDEDETTRLFRDVFGVEAEDSRVARAITAAEGWAAGLVLTGVALQAQPHAHVDIARSPQHRQFVDAFIEEAVLGACSPDVRDFMQRTAILPVLEPSLCDLLTGRTDSAELLRHLTERNLLTDELAGASVTYRYHSLLRRALQRSHGPLERGQPDRVERVVASLAARGQVVEATDLALRAAPPGDAEKWIRQACGPALAQGYAATVVRWLSAMPADQLHSQPDLLLVLARAAGVTGDVLTAMAAVREVRQLVATHDASPGVRIGLALLDTAVGVWAGVLAETASSLRDLLSMVADRPDDPVLELLALTRTSLLSTLAAVSLMDGRLDEARAVAEQAIDLDELEPLTRHAVLCLGVRPLASAWAGREQEAAAMVEEALPRIRSWQADANEAILFWSAAAWAGPPALAEQSLACAYRLASRTTIPLLKALPAVTELRVRQRLAQYDQLPEAARRAEEAVSRVPEQGHLADVLRAQLLSMQQYPAVPPDLTEQELVILRGLAAGKSRKEVAQETHYSVNTVKTYLRSAYRKLGVADRAQAVARARAWGLLDHQGVTATTRVAR